MKTYGLSMNDDVKIKLGSGNDAELYFDGTNFYVKTSDGNQYFQLKSNEDALKLTADGISELFYNSSSRLRSSSTGIEISNDGSSWSGVLEPGQDAPAGTAVLGYNGYFHATRIYNAIYNDIVDFHDLNDELLSGKCYYDTPNGAKICNRRCKKGIIGMASDTYGFALGSPHKSKVPIAIGGWVLAFVDKKYETGTVLTNDKKGNLTKMKWWEKLFHPERIAGIYHKKEENEFWGPKENNIKVNGRHWIKVK